MTGRQILLEFENDTIDLNDGGEDTSMNEASGINMHDVMQDPPPNVDSFSPANAPSVQSTRTPAFRGTKQKAPMVDSVESQVEKMTVGIGLVADALNIGNCNEFLCNNDQKNAYYLVFPLTLDFKHCFRL
ncbi:hypothetical protein SESBI_16925 [Sesbania bispinosa]|nr:hypothetical protein SESBI_16925 [Sesbania bispinosa]